MNQTASLAMRRSTHSRGNVPTKENKFGARRQPISLHPVKRLLQKLQIRRIASFLALLRQGYGAAGVNLKRSHHFILSNVFCKSSRSLAPPAFSLELSIHFFSREFFVGRSF